MTTNTDYGTWCNRVDQASPSLEQTVSDYVSGADREWRERIETTGAFEAMVSDYRDAINKALPDAVTLAGDRFFGPYYDEDCDFEGYPADEHGSLDIKAIVDGIDLAAIVDKHDPDNVDGVETATWSVVRGETPFAHAVDPAQAGVAIPDGIVDWATGHGLSVNDPDVYLLVTPTSEARSDVIGEIAYREHPMPAEDLARLRAELDA